MAASAIDEAVRNCVAVGADPARIAILDNFCWGYTDRPETLGELVRAALACHDVALALGTPFISGKDSLNNEYSYDANGQRVTISIPPTLLISALGQVADVRQCVTMDLKQPGNLLYLVGNTRDELAGSHLELVHGSGCLSGSACGSEVPRVDAALAKKTFAAMHQAIQKGLVRACHDLSEGGLAVSIAEMAFAGGCGARIRLAEVPTDVPHAEHGDHFESVLLYSESNTRFLVEVPQAKQVAFEAALKGLPHAHIGEVTDISRLEIAGAKELLVEADLATLKEAWQKPLRW
jgi:phosphoribosylformylglycinamidine synthase